MEQVGGTRELRQSPWLQIQTPIKFGFSKRHGISTISRDLVLLGRLVLLVKMVKLVPLVLLALLVKLLRLVKLAVAGWVHQCSV